MIFQLDNYITDKYKSITLQSDACKKTSNACVVLRKINLQFKGSTVDTITADHRNFYFLIPSVYFQMPPNTRINLIKRSHKTR